MAVTRRILLNKNPRVFQFCFFFQCSTMAIYLKSYGISVKLSDWSKIALQIKAVLENITNLRPDGDDFRWYIKVKCANCGEATDRFVYACLEETSPMKGSRGSANLLIKCHLCGRENSMNIVPESIHPYNIENDSKFVSIVEFDCRGLEPIDFQPTVGFIANSSESKMEFKDISFAEGDWTDYDENAAVSVGVYELEHKFIKA